MSIVITSGGTAGHIYPALAVASELTARGENVLFAGSIGGMEERLATQQGLAYQAFAARGFNRQNPLTLLSASLLLARSSTQARHWLVAQGARAVAAFGGYVSLPVGRAALKEGIPLLIHEQNSAMGWANRHLSTRAAIVALTYAEAYQPRKASGHASGNGRFEEGQSKDMRSDSQSGDGLSGGGLSGDGLSGGGLSGGGRVRLTGNPVRTAFSVLSDPARHAALRQSFRAELGFASDALVLLVFGGSQGARHINQAVVSLAPALLAHPKLAVLQLTGPKELASVEAALASSLTGSLGSSALAGSFSGSLAAGSLDSSALGSSALGSSAPSSLVPADAPVPLLAGTGSKDSQKRWVTLGYCDNMPGAFAAADLVLSRAGASSLAELAVAGKPALLVPYPYATANHQYKNAASLVAAGAACMVRDSELDTPLFASTLLNLINNTAQRAHKLTIAQGLSHANAAAEVAKLVLSLADKSR